LRKLAIGAAIAASVVTSAARADWYEATTDHFIINANTSEARIRDFATRLERFDAALKTFYGVEEDPGRRSNRVRLFATSQGAINRLCGSDCPYTVAGFYHPKAGGSVIFTAALSGSQNSYDLSSQAVLLHEYSHHFMYSNFPAAYPFWFTEGFAEFNANVKFGDDGAINIGLPADYRAYALFRGTPIPLRQLLAPRPVDLVDPARVDAIYGRSWLFLHYLMMDDGRRKQLNVYLQKVAKGEPSIQAATEAFGDLTKLQSALGRYLDGNRFHQMQIPPPKTPIAIEVKPLSAGASAMMAVHMRSTAGVDTKEAKALLPEAEKVGANYPGDPRVQDWLAEAEFDAHNDTAADAAADRALTADPADRTAMLYKGRVAVRRATIAHSTDPKVWSIARGWYAKANRADPEAALPLLLYYQSYLAQRVRAPDLAVKGLEKAEALAPEDNGVHWLLATRKLQDGDTATARALLVPVAFAPHGAKDDNKARTVIDLIDAGKVAEARAKMEGDDSTSA